MVCVLCILCPILNQQKLPGKAERTAWQVCVEPWHSQSPSHAARLLVWEQHLPLHSLLPMKLVFPEFPCSQVLRSTPAHCEGRLVAPLEMKCSKKWMMLGFVNVGSCCDLCTQVPKQMVQGCSPWAGEGAVTDRQPHPCLLRKRGDIPFFMQFLYHPLPLSSYFLIAPLQHEVSVRN